MLTTREISSKLKKVGASSLENGLYVSTNYEFCHIYKGNRYVFNLTPNNSFISQSETTEAEKKFKNIIKLMKQYGSERPDQGQEYLFDKNIPIIMAYIQNKFFIVDGQNRLSVCKLLQIPYYFRVLTDIKDEKELLSYIKRLNFVKSNWSKSQQIGSAARLGNPYAQFLVEAEKKYDVPITNMTYFTIGKDGHKTKSDFQIKPFDMQKANDILQLICYIAKQVSTNEKEAIKLRHHNRFTNFITAVYEQNKVKELLFQAKNRIVFKIQKANNIGAYAEAFNMFNSIKH